eukprot:g61638.t1
MGRASPGIAMLHAGPEAVRLGAYYFPQLILFLHPASLWRATAMAGQNNRLKSIWPGRWHERGQGHTVRVRPPRRAVWAVCHHLQCQRARHQLAWFDTANAVSAASTAVRAGRNNNND